jgi:hypothetical protein
MSVVLSVISIIYLKDLHLSSTKIVLLLRQRIRGYTLAPV